jgi:hypothetical protein
MVDRQGAVPRFGMTGEIDVKEILPGFSRDWSGFNFGQVNVSQGENT